MVFSAAVLRSGGRVGVVWMLRRVMGLEVEGSMEGRGKGTGKGRGEERRKDHPPPTKHQGIPITTTMQSAQLRIPSSTAKPSITTSQPQMKFHFGLAPIAEICYNTRFCTPIIQQSISLILVQRPIQKNTRNTISTSQVV